MLYQSDFPARPKQLFGKNLETRFGKLNFNPVSLQQFFTITYQERQRVMAR